MLRAVLVALALTSCAIVQDEQPSASKSSAFGMSCFAPISDIFLLTCHPAMFLEQRP